MYLLPCPKCSSSISVPPSQAGDETSCGQCGEMIDIPKLGELRKLPRADEDVSAEKPVGSSAVSVGGSRIGFVAAALAATASLIVAGFCTLRWAMIDVPTTTEGHIAEYEEAYQTAEAAMLIKDFEEMEARGLELPIPYRYKEIEVTKQTWGRNALVACAVAAITLLAAMLLSMGGRTPAEQ